MKQIVYKVTVINFYFLTLRFVLTLFVLIIIVSLRVNLDMGKAVYSWMVQRDKDIAGTVVRSTTIPEELGRIVYFLSDKTGTLTQNEMVSLEYIFVCISSSWFNSKDLNMIFVYMNDAGIEVIVKSVDRCSSGSILGQCLLELTVWMRSVYTHLVSLVFVCVKQM